MALSRGRLTEVVNVSAGSTVGVLTVSNSNKIYVKSILAHNVGLTTNFPARFFVNYVSNGESPTTDNRIFNVSIGQSESVLLEPSYPLVLTTTGDSLSVGCSISGAISNAQINVIVSGDQEV